MSILRTILPPATPDALPDHPAKASSAPLARLLATVALASAAVGGLITAALDRLQAATELPHPASVAPGTPGSAVEPQYSVPAAYDVLRDRTDPLSEPAPTF